MKDFNVVRSAEVLSQQEFLPDCVGVKNIWLEAVGFNMAAPLCQH